MNETSSNDTGAGLPAEDASTRRTLGAVDSSFYLIGVGASAGGLDAIKQLIAQAGEGFSHSFVIIQHISPDHKSLMTEILARETGLAVREVTDDMPVLAGHIYLIPPKTNVMIQGTIEDDRPMIEHGDLESRAGQRFSLVAPSPRPKLNLPIDVFFHSLAEAVGERAIAIVLSGTGTDGSRGLRAVKDRDGFVMVQDPLTADFDGMPLSAISTNLVDMVAAPDAMVAELKRYITLRESGSFDIEQLFQDRDVELEQLLVRISEEAGIDFTKYKKPTLKRRIARRIALNDRKSLQDYIQFTHEHPNELAILHREFLVGVTNFFRDASSWKALSEQILPGIFDKGPIDEPVKIWSVGCSTGEEAYTIAFILEKYRTDHDIKRDFRIFASDVNEDAVRSAKDGIYSESVIDEIPPEYRNSHFLSFHGGTFHITSTIRNRVIFNAHDVLQEPPYINTDLVICRNMLIYLSPEMQKKVLSLFSFSLRNEGHLFLGAAETVTHQYTKFETVVSAFRIYRNIRPNQRSQFRRPLLEKATETYPLPRLRRLATREPQRSSSAVGPILENTLRNIDGCVLILDEGGNVLESVGDYLKFINLPSQAFSANVFDLVHDRLKSSISLLIRRAETQGSAESLGTKCSFGDRIEQVDLFCQRIEWETQPVAYSILLRKTKEIATPQVTINTDQLSQDADMAMITRLEGEVETLRELLSATTEDLGISNEELQTANEELTVSNEELQANNEEMQSINEELHTVNAENADKIVQLEAANADIENLLNTADLAVLFLDNALCIRRFNPAFCRYVDLKVGDVGRGLASFTSNFAQPDYTHLLDAIATAQDDRQEVQREMLLQDGSYALVRVRPFEVEVADRFAGLAITVLDITQSRKLKEELRIQRDQLQGLIEAESAGFWDWDLRDGSEYVSPRLFTMLGFDHGAMAPDEQGWRSFVNPKDLPALEAALQTHYESRGSIPFHKEVRFSHRDGTERWFICRGRVVDWSNDGQPLRMLGVQIDITDMKSRQLTLEHTADELYQFSHSTIHNLLQPLNTLLQGFDLLKTDLGESRDVADTVDILQGVVDRMRTRVMGIRSYSSMFSDQDVPKMLDLTKIAKDTVTDLKTRVEDASAQINIPDLPQVFGHEQQVAALMQNLISNSLKYRSPKRDCVITLSGEFLADGYVAITVKDTGQGIAKSERDKVFDLFQSGAGHDGHGDRGVGLAVCRRILSQHGGTIQIAKSGRSGTSVVFTLPTGAPSMKQARP